MRYFLYLVTFERRLALRQTTDLRFTRVATAYSSYQLPDVSDITQIYFGRIFGIYLATRYPAVAYWYIQASHSMANVGFLREVYTLDTLEACIGGKVARSASRRSKTAIDLIVPRPLHVTSFFEYALPIS